MGNNRKRREAFLTQHPLCCFCGGGAPATTEDHLPARAFFQGRAWPEGYVFPACSACNSGSSDDELILSVIVRVNPYQGWSERQQTEFEHALSGLRFRLPEFYSKIKEATRGQTRRYFREHGMGRPIIGGSEAYMVLLPVEVTEVMNRYGAKLGKALHYFHTGNIVPPSGAVVVRCFLNSELHATEIPSYLEGILGAGPILRRDIFLLNDQFRYQLGVTDDGGGGVYWIQFGSNSVGILAAVFLDEQAYQSRLAAQNQIVNI